MVSAVVVTPVVVPDRFDHRDWLDYHQVTLLANHEKYGGPEMDDSPQASWEQAKSSTLFVRGRLLARMDGKPVGYASYLIAPRDDPNAADVTVFVDPQYRKQGIGTYLVEALREHLPEEIQRLISYVVTPLPTGEVIHSPTGAGAVPAAHPGVRLVLGLGFKLGQVMRISRYEFADPLVAPSDALAEAMAVAGPEYEIVTHEGPVGKEAAADYAELKQRMSTDMPTGEITIPGEIWDEARLREFEANNLPTYRMFKAMAWHRPTNRVVALSELWSSRESPTNLVHQEDTIVAPEHRGCRLGMAVKAANLIQVRSEVPQASAIITWNAEENKYMLAVNDALGYRTLAMEAAFEYRG